MHGQLRPGLESDPTQVFESGAILAYLADAYGGLDTPAKRSEVMPWLVWANASLDPCIFIETPEGRVVDTGARREAGKVTRLSPDRVAVCPFSQPEAATNLSPACR